MAQMALDAKVSKAASIASPLPASEANLSAGAEIYVQKCTPCHGMSGQPEPDMSKAMFPHPPQLFGGQGVTDDPVGETYWKVTNGIRLTGMPAFQAMLSDNQRWQVSLLLADAGALPESVQKILTSPPAAPSASAQSLSPSP